MCSSAVANAVPESSMWHGAISVEDAQLVRVRHAEKVEEWLDEADFCTELFKLHEKYGIDLGEEGYADYRDYLRTNYYQKLQTYGPTPNPLDEGCDCIFCKMHAEETSAEPEESVGRLGQVPAELPSDGECESSDRRLGQVPAEPRGNFGCCDEQRPTRQPSEKKLGPVPAYEDYEDDELVVDHAVQEGHPEIGPSPVQKNSIAADDVLIANDESVSRYDSVGGVEPDRGENELPPEQMFVRVYPPNPPRPVAELARSKKDEREVGPRSGTYAMNESDAKDEGRLGQVPAEPPDNFNIRDDHRRRKKKLGPVPAYVRTAGEKAWLKKMSGTVF